MSSIASLVPRRARRWLRRHGGPLGSVVAFDTEQPAFALTYDDGPEPGGTDAILPVLADFGATATFFVLMTRVRQHPSLLRDVIDAGHEVGLHGVDHQPISRLSYGQVKQRTLDAKAELEDAAGAPVRWFRPPYGRQSVTSFLAVRAAGLTPVVWGPTSWDAREATLEERRTRAVAGAGAGSILLCHDGFARVADGGRRDDGPSVDRAEVARTILPAYRDLGLEARSVGDLAATGTTVRGIWFGR